MASNCIPFRSAARVACRIASTVPRQQASRLHIASQTRWTPASRIARPCAIATPVQRRCIASEAELKPTKQYDFEKIKSLALSPSTPQKALLIDVREPHEFASGYIPGAINIPVQSAPDALYLSEEEFEDRFGFEKPGKETEVVFYCKAGVRSRAAAQLALRNGYEKVGEYGGSWLDWVQRGGKVEGGK